MSFSPPLPPKLLSLADFGGDLIGFLEHVEQYRQNTELKERMKKTKKNLLLQKSAHPSLLDAEVQQENFYNEPVSALIPEPSTMAPAVLFSKGPVLKSFKRQVAIIEDHDVPRKFWIL